MGSGEGRGSDERVVGSGECRKGDVELGEGSGEWGRAVGS